MYYSALNGVDFENLVLQRYRGTLKKNEKWTKILTYKSPAIKEHEEISPLYREREAKFCGNGRWWWEPPKESIPGDFCMQSSMHGLRFVSQPKRHLSERIFWSVVFLLSVVAAVLLINDVWTRYYNNPVIVSLTPQEIGIDEIPFPAVTICNMNKFPKSELEKRLKIIQNSNKNGVQTEEEILAREEIKMINAACTTQSSFAKQNNFAYSRGNIDPSLTEGGLNNESKREMVEFLVTHTLPCEKLIRYCVWSEDIVDCKAFFKAIVTNYGMCCTFNMIPEAFLLRFKLRLKDSKRRKTPYVARWSEEEHQEWKQWNYIKDGFLLPRYVTQPRRQSRAGLQNGLSILIDPNVGNSFCPMSDSEGVRMMLHTPLELPQVQELGTIIGLGQEVFTEIHPEVTLADDDIIDFSVNDRKCLFSNEHTLDFYRPYTASNCMDECSSKILIELCNCTQYFMPRSEETNVCDADMRSKDYNCIMEGRANMADALKIKCEHCLSPCVEIAYNMEVTVSNLHKASTLWGDHENQTKPEWENNKVGILHFYLGTDSTVPKIRKRLYGTTDLIANTGGLLGLCLGFSVMSLIEVGYFVTLRAFWHYKRKKESVLKIANRFIGFIWRTRNKNINKVGIDFGRYPILINQANRYSYGFQGPTFTQNTFNKFRL